jgi:ubiquinone/menaquinone biosynthesis C-methylase UbiE
VTQLLDYGCGHAGFAVAAATELGLKVHGCDINADLIDDLRGRYGPSINFFTVSDSEPRLPLEDGQVSTVTCCDALEHMPAALRVTALREMRRVLADDGVLVVTTPHKGLLSAADPQNVKYHFPRIHRFVYTAFKGRDKYERRYGGQRFGGFSSGARRHAHFSARQLSEMLREAGFTVEQIRYYTLLYPLVKTVLWFAESAAGRVYGARRLRALCWRVYLWDADLEPGRLSSSIGIRARKSDRVSFQQR